jgi:hypothetical protein
MGLPERDWSTAGVKMDDMVMVVKRELFQTHQTQRDDVTSCSVPRMRKSDWGTWPIIDFD